LGGSGSVPGPATSSARGAVAKFPAYVAHFPGSTKAIDPSLTPCAAACRQNFKAFAGFRTFLDNWMRWHRTCLYYGRELRTPPLGQSRAITITGGQRQCPY
jgi:hypothetical protein